MFMTQTLVRYMFVLVGALLASPAIYAAELEHREVVIWSEGVRLAGDVFQPAGLDENEKLPGILLVTGWGGAKKNLNRAYAPQFAELGFVVLTFDFKGWGESNGPLLLQSPLPGAQETTEVSIKAGHVRDIVDPFSMLEDTRAALHYLVGEGNVDSSRIGIWGTSYGGGLSLVTAANDSRIRALVSQIGAVDNLANLSMIPAAAASKWETQRARGEIPAFPGPESKNPALKGYPDYVRMKRYDPAAWWDRIEIPVLSIDAEDEELFDRNKNGKALHEAIKGRVPSEYLVLPGKHYDIYRGEGYQKALKAAQDWFVKYLKNVEK
jgi:uncharacterized protein